MEKNKDIAALMNRVQHLPVKINAIEGEISSVKQRMRELKAAGLIYATGHMREKKYFTLVYPQKNGVRPSPTYIGTNEEKIQEARDAIARAKEYDGLSQLAEKYSEILREASRVLSTLERVLSNK